MWGQLLTTCSNVLKKPNGEILVAVNQNQLQIMASETVDPIDWSYPPPSWAVPPERLVHIINQFNLSGNRTCNSYNRATPTCDALLCVSHTLQSALESGQEARIVQVDFSAAFDRVNHLCILYKLCSVGINWRFCPVYIDTVPIKPITASYGGSLSK